MLKTCKADASTRNSEQRVDIEIDFNREAYVLFYEKENLNYLLEWFL